jgi:hypothetical protein
MPAVLCPVAWHLYLLPGPLLWLVSKLEHCARAFQEEGIKPIRSSSSRYLSSTATLLFISYQLHNIISWRKIKSFLPRWGQLTFIITIVIVQPYWIVEAWNNFQYFNGLGNQSNIQTRPWEALARYGIPLRCRDEERLKVIDLRDPWWIFTTVKLIHVIKRDYDFTFMSLIRTSPRFAVMILCMLLSLVFLVMDIIVTVTRMSRSSGINPYWRVGTLKNRE